MASPFRMFRKHQKVMLAVVAILAMGAFVIADPLVSFFGGNRSGRKTAKSVVVSWNEGELTEDDLEYWMQLRRLLYYFLHEAAARGSQNSGLPVQVPILGESDSNEQEAVQQLLLTNKATELGFVVSNREVNHYLQRLTHDSLDKQSLKDIIHNMSYRGRRITISTIFDALRQELAVRQLLVNYALGMDVLTPAQRWSYWLRVNDLVRIEHLPLSVSKFLAEVSDPTEEDLSAFFEAYKNQFQRSSIIDGTIVDSPQPGFKIPAKIICQGLKADFDHFVDLTAAEITAEQVEQYYRQNKRLFVRPDLLGPEDEASPDESSQAATETAHQTSETEPAVGRRDNAKTEQQPPEKDPAVSVRDNVKPDPLAEETQPGEEGSANPNPRGSTEPNYAPLDEVRDEIRKLLSEQQAALNMESVLLPLKGKLYRYYDLLSEWEFSNQEGSTNVKRKPRPEPPDLQSWVKKNQLEFVDTTLVSHRQLRKLPLGETVVVEGQGQQKNFADWVFTDLAIYQPVMSVGMSEDNLGSRYLTVKTEQTEPRVAQLNELRNEVTKAWKTQVARVKAGEEAERLAQEVNTSGKSLRDHFDEQIREQVVQPAPFSQLSAKSMPGRPGLVRLEHSQVDGVDLAGPRFLEVVFRLADGKSDATMNLTTTTAHVVRMEKHESPLKLLRQEFLKQSDSWYFQLQQANQEQLLGDFVRSIVDSAQLKWNRLPDASR